MDFAELLNMYQSRVNNTLTSLLGSLHMYCTPLVHYPVVKDYVLS